MGERVTAVQQRAEWIEYQEIFDDVLTRFSAMLARNTKLQKAHLQKIADDIAPVSRPTAEPTGKAALRARVAAMRGLPARVNAPTWHSSLPVNNVQEEQP